MAGAGPGEHPKKWDPLRIFATVEASSIKFCTQIGFGSSLPKTTIRTKISGGRARGASKQIWDPERISAAVEASNFKFGRPTQIWFVKFGRPTQIWFGTSLPKTTFSTKIGGVLASGASQKIGTPYLFLQPLKLATSNLVYNLGLGLSYQKNNV